MDMGLKNRVVLVTGGSKGIGKATAKKFAEEQAHVFITYANDQETALKTVNEIRQQGFSCSEVQMDLRDQVSIEKAVKTVAEKFGRIDVLINNAVDWGSEAPSPQSLEHTSTDAWFAMIDHNLKGTYLVTKYTLPYMKNGSWGRLVHISTNLAEDGMAGVTSYPTSKSALHGFSKSLSLELAAEGIYSNVVLPGFTLTEQNSLVFPKEVLEKHAESIPTKRLGIPDDVANLIVYLGSNANSFVNGEIIRATGGK
ncbi:SDR family NAD(P)-dependent oxidoreductase [Shimazuella kribbensis]|uniref:SDR family NAD(P)-dependent oxidoreductase n=1 Tax=Shimazuella kribbensis TaxID=139808 RepID=UPI0003FE7787|nr:SDR family NAD(P)-dependent oxidoreductase [Shimazuella kribbensis]